MPHRDAPLTETGLPRPARIAHLLGLVPSTVHLVLVRFGQARLSHLDQAAPISALR